MLDCNATSADQDIRLVCHDPTKCDHLNLNGAENTVVRLPNNVSVLSFRECVVDSNTPACAQCSSEPFALVTRVWVHDDQSIPASRRSLLERRDDPQRLVQGISLSTDFASTNSSQ